MKIAIDFDDTIFPTIKSFLEYNNDKYKSKAEIKQLEHSSAYKLIGIKKEEMIKRFIEFTNTQKHKEIMPIKDSISVIKNLKQKHELFIITARNKKTKNGTMFLIDKYYKNHFKEVIFLDYTNNKKDEKFEICKNIGINLIIEDDPKNAISCAKNGIKVLLFNNENQNYWSKTEKNKNIKLVKTWKEIETHIKNL